MANSFGVTGAMLARTFFPHLATFHALSAPSSTAVDEVIARKAARLAAKLLKESIDADDLVNSGATADAYLLGQDILLLEVAVEVHGMATGMAPELVKVWEGRLKDTYKELEEEGWLAMGAAEPISDTTPLADGPHSHLDHGLEMEEEEDLSPLTHKLRAGDLL